MAGWAGGGNEDRGRVGCEGLPEKDKVLAFRYDGEWLGRLYEEKEVTVYHKMSDEELVVLTAIARYGSGFAQRGP